MKPVGDMLWETKLFYVVVAGLLLLGTVMFLSLRSAPVPEEPAMQPIHAPGQ